MTAAKVPSLPEDAHGAAGKHWLSAGWDLKEGLRRWQLWWLLGLNDIRQRYRRSRLGQFWITVSMASFVVAVGLVFGGILNADITRYLPFLTVNIVIWNFLSQVLTESCAAFVQAEGYIRQERLPKTIFIMRLFVRNVLILAHNAILIPIVFVVFGVSTSFAAILVIPGLAILFINLFFAALFLSVICTRFRDLPQVVTNVLQIAFFLTPVMWEKAQLPANLSFVFNWNPLASHLTIITDPLLGQIPSFDRYATCLVATLAMAALALPFFARYRERIVYWL